MFHVSNNHVLNGNVKVNHCEISQVLCVELCTIVGEGFSEVCCMYCTDEENCKLKIKQNCFCLMNLYRKPNP